MGAKGAFAFYIIIAKSIYTRGLCCEAQIN